jgi:hypothetical protein
MNIVTPIPTTVLFTTANVNTEAARRDNVQRESIPQTSGAESSAAETGLGSESDRVKTAGQQPATYEKPQQQTQNSNGEAQNTGADKDNAEDPSAGKENAESRQQQESAEKQEIKELEARDKEVRAHEQAHSSVGGQYAGSPSYEYQVGPDGRQYAVSGEVSIDISKESSPEDTVRKMQQVKSAALAPTDPSPQDLRVASEATQRASEARREASLESAQRAQESLTESLPVDVAGSQQSRGPTNIANENTNSSTTGPELDEIVEGIDIGQTTRQLSRDPVAEAVGLESDGAEFRQQLANRDAAIINRVNVIENFYQNVSTPRSEGLQQSA